MDLIKSGRSMDIFYAKTCATTKISTVAGYHVELAKLFFGFTEISCSLSSSRLTFIQVQFIFMPQTLKKVGRAYWFLMHATSYEQCMLGF